MRGRLLAAALVALFATGLATLPASAAPVQSAPTTTPIKHFVYMLQGDRSFDNYFGTYPGAEGIPEGTCQRRVVTGPDTDCVEPFSLHGKAVQALGAGTVELNNQYDEGRMDGFVAAYQNQGRDGTAVMGYYDERDVPTYWGLAERYTLLDHFFSSTRAGPRVNRSYWVSGSPPPKGSPKAVAVDYAKHWTIFDRLQAAGVDWKFYVQGYDPAQNYRTNSKTTPTTQPVRVPLLNYPRFLDDPKLSSRIVDLSQYYQDLDKGELPAVSYIASNGPSERSTRSVRSGQQLVTNLVGSLMVSSAWNSSAFLLSYDGSGGWFDHVKPPQVDSQGYGMRVPALLVSPFSRPGVINSAVLDYTSGLAFIEDNWKLPPLASRDAAATSIAVALDLESGPRPADVRFNEPAQAKAPAISVTAAYWCYGAVFCLVIGLVAFALLRSRRTPPATTDRPSSPRKILRAIPMRAKT